MRKAATFLMISLLALLIVSCKNETNEDTPISEISESLAPPPIKKKDLTPEQMERLSSVMSQLMLDDEFKKFASYSVTAGITEMLSNEKGPFTVFAPINRAFENVAPESKSYYSNQINRKSLEEMLKSHIVQGMINTTKLNESIGKSGKTTLKTMAGTTLTITRVGENLLVSSDGGGKGTILGSEIPGSNGVVYAVDGVLRLH